MSYCNSFKAKIEQCMHTGTSGATVIVPTKNNTAEFITSRGSSQVGCLFFTAIAKDGCSYRWEYTHNSDQPFIFNTYWVYDETNPEILFTDIENDETVLHSSAPEIVSWMCVCVRQYWGKRKPTTTINSVFLESGSIVDKLALTMDSNIASTMIYNFYNAYSEEAFSRIESEKQYSLTKGVPYHSIVQGNDLKLTKIPLSTTNINFKENSKDEK